MNEIRQRLERMIAYRDAYQGRDGVERRRRNRAVRELWAALPSQRDRDKFRDIAGQPKEQ